MVELADTLDLGSSICGFKSRLSHAGQISNDGRLKCESSSVVELHLAKVDVAGPSPVFRLKPDWFMIQGISWAFSFLIHFRNFGI